MGEINNQCPINTKGLCNTTSTDGYNGRGGSGPDPPPLVTKKVTIFGHKKRDPQRAVLGSPLPVHLHGRGGGGVMQHGIHSTFDTHSAVCMEHFKCHSASFNVIHCHHSQ